MSEAGQINVSPNREPHAHSIVTTRPKHILRHDISEEELDMLGESRTDMAQEIMLIAVGSALGTAPAALSAMNAYFKDREEALTSLLLSDFIQIVLFWCSIVIVSCVGLIFLRRKGRSKSLIEKIKRRSEEAIGSEF